MTKEEKLLLNDEISKLFLSKGKDVNQLIIATWLEDFENHNFERICWAIREIRKSSEAWPSSGMIIEKANSFFLPDARKEWEDYKYSVLNGYSTTSEQRAILREIDIDSSDVRMSYDAMAKAEKHFLKRAVEIMARNDGKLIIGFGAKPMINNSKPKEIGNV